MNTSITEQTIESYFNLIRNWDAEAKQQLINRISASLGIDKFSDQERWALLQEMNSDSQLELLLDEARKN